MCRVFPTVTSCNLPNVGAGGGEQVKSHMNVSNGQHLHGEDYVYSFPMSIGKYTYGGKHTTFDQR